MKININSELFTNIRTMLGQPIRQVELVDEQMSVALSNALSTFELYSELNDKTDFEKVKNVWVEKYTLANCKEILGRVRGKFEGKIGIEESPKYMDYKTLLTEAEKEKYQLVQLLEK